jgi:TatD DNase family protein
VGLVDTHAHLGDAVFDGDRGDVLQRARDAGVTTVITVGETLADARRNLELAEEHPEIRPAAGLYPTHIDDPQAEALETWIREHRDRLVAIGEVGLDHWKVKDEPDRETQRGIFGRFIDLAIDLDLPLNVHSRSAGRHAIASLLERGARKVQLHAFDGKPSTALPAVEAGYFFSVPPSVVRSRQKQKLVGRLPLSSLLLETDSPVLGPVAGERNEPANVRVALEAVAEIKGLTTEEVAESVSENTVRLFGDAVREASPARGEGRRSIWRR